MARPRMLVAGAGNTISNTFFIIVSLERHGSVMKEDSEGVLFVQPSITITEALAILQQPQSRICSSADPKEHETAL